MVSYKRFIVIHVDGSEFNVSDNAPVFDEMEVVEAAAFDNLEQRLATQKKATDALLDFAQSVAGGSSWWDDVWSEIEKELTGDEG